MILMLKLSHQDLSRYFLVLIKDFESLETSPLVSSQILLYQVLFRHFIEELLSHEHTSRTDHAKGLMLKDILFILMKVLINTNKVECSWSKSTFIKVFLDLLRLLIIILLLRLLDSTLIALVFLISVGSVLLVLVTLLHWFLRSPFSVKPVSVSVREDFVMKLLLFAHFGPELRNVFHYIFGRPLRVSHLENLALLLRKVYVRTEWSLGHEGRRNVGVIKLVIFIQRLSLDSLCVQVLL